MWCVSIVSIQLLNAISNGPFVRLKTEKLLLSTNHWASTWSRQLKTTTGFLPLPCILSFSIIASQEGEQHKRAQAKTCQMTCKKQWYCHSLQSPCSLHLWPYWMEWKENEMILWYKLRIVLRLNMRCCRSQLTELKADYSPGEENDSTYSLCIVQPCHPVWPIIISDSNGTRGGGDPVPPPWTSHHTQASSCNGSPRHGRATGNQNCCRLIVYLTHYSCSLQRATSIEFFMGVLLFDEYQLKNEDLGPRWLE